MAREIRVVPANTGTHDAGGTEVWVGDEKLSVTKIELTADAHDRVWRARIECFAVVEGEIIAEEMPDGA